MSEAPPTPTDNTTAAQEPKPVQEGKTRFRPLHAALLVLMMAGAILAADYALEGGFSRSSYERVGPDRNGVVSIELAELSPNQVRFYRFLNYGNQEVRFFVGRDLGGEVHVAFDANEACYKLKRGYRSQEGWLVCNKCDKAFELNTVNYGGTGCSPIPVQHRIEGETLLLAEADILKGWRLFR